MTALARSAPPRRRLSLPWLTFVLVAAEEAAYAAWKGIMLLPDSDTYRAWADALVRRHFDVLAFARATTSDYPPLLYVVWVSLVALLRRALGERWTVGVVVLDVAAGAAAGALVVWLVERLTRSRLAAAAAALLYAGSFEILDWSRYALSDLTYLALTTALAALVARALLGARRRPAAVALALLVPLSFYRPTFVAMLPPLLAASLVGLGGDRPAESLGGRPAAWRVLAAGVAAALAALTAFAAVMRDPTRWPLRAGSALIRFTAGHYRLGEVIWDREEMYRTPPRTDWDFLVLIGDRFAHFFAPVSPDYDAPHTAWALLFYVPAYALAAYGTAAALRRPGWLDARRRCVVLLSALLVLSVATFHAMVQIDYDWRYRLPVLPHLVLLAGVGVAALLDRRAAEA
jgi:hypothetical protein